MLNQKVALITGASRGIGKAIALAYAKEGADLALVFAGREDAAKECATLCEEFGAVVRIYQCDVKDFDACKELVDTVKKDFGQIDILVNNAGITRDGLIALMKEDAFDEVIATNLKGSFNMIRHCTPLLMRQRSGKIINMSSISGIMGNAGQANYSASKAGVIGLTKSVARELAPRGITCNAIAPGFIATDMTVGLDTEDHPLIKEIPLKRLGKPEDITGAAVFLASSASDYITGEVLRVDGGLAI